jgi:hypothetical protein
MYIYICIYIIYSGTCFPEHIVYIYAFVQKKYIYIYIYVFPVSGRKMAIWVAEFISFQVVFERYVGGRAGLKLRVYAAFSYEITMAAFSGGIYSAVSLRKIAIREPERAHKAPLICMYVYIYHDTSSD